MKYAQPITLSKLEIARVQLERAIHLFLEESDYVCALTLAGASEEILGKLIEQQGGTSELKEFAQECVDTGKTVYGENWELKEFFQMGNCFRNELKHIGDGQPITLSGYVTIAMLDRAIANYFRITGKESELMKRFNWEVHGI